MVLRTSGRGFTLIEMAIVVVIIGLLLSGSLLAVSPVIQSSKVADTNARLDRLEQALTVYVIQNGCLPCPAINGTSATGWSTSDGTAAGEYGPTNTSATRACSNATCGSLWVGAAPWKTLGISEADITDAWGDRIDYAVTGALTTTAGSSMVRTPPSSYPAGTQVVWNARASGASQQTSTAAYVLISFGPDTIYANMATTGTARSTTGGQYGYTGTVASARNNPAGHAAATDPFAQGDYVPTNSSSHFDDLVRWRASPLVIQSCGSNACGNP